MDILLSAKPWNANTDPRLIGYPFMSGVPVSVLACFLVFGILARKWPYSGQVQSFLKPWLLVTNGFMFGCHGAGLAFLASLTNGYADTLSLERPNITVVDELATWTEEIIINESVMRLTLVLLALRLVIMLEALMVAAIKGEPPSVARLFNDAMISFIIYVTFRLAPGGPGYYFAMTYISVYSYIYGYYTLKSALLTDKSLETTARKVKTTLQFLWSVSLFGHLFYATHSGQNLSFGASVLLLLEGMFALTIFMVNLSKIKTVHLKSM